MKFLGFLVHWTFKEIKSLFILLILFFYIVSLVIPIWLAAPFFLALNDFSTMPSPDGAQAFWLALFFTFSHFIPVLIYALFKIKENYNARYHVSRTQIERVIENIIDYLQLIINRHLHNVPSHTNR
jgi:hypothetical protein